MPRASGAAAPPPHSARSARQFPGSAGRQRPELGFRFRAQGWHEDTNTREVRADLRREAQLRLKVWASNCGVVVCVLLALGSRLLGLARGSEFGAQARYVELQLLCWQWFIMIANGSSQGLKRALQVP